MSKHVNFGYVFARYKNCYLKKLYKNVHENVFLTAKKVVLKFSIKLENAYSVGKQKSEPIHDNFMQNYVLSK